MIRQNRNGAQYVLHTLVAIVSACGPGSRPVENDGDGSGGSAEASLITAPDMGTAFECPRARWHEGSLVIDDSVDVDSLRDIGGVTSDLEVRGTSALTDLEFLSCLQEVGRGVMIADNVALENLHGLERLQRIGSLHANGVDSAGGLSVVRNQALVHMLELESLELIGSVWVAGNPRLADISLPAIRRIRLLEVGGCGGSVSNASLSEGGDYPLLEYLRVIRVGLQGFTSLASFVELAERGVEFEEASFERNFLLPAAEIDAFAAAAGIAVEACENRDDEEVCEPCISD